MEKSDAAQFLGNFPVAHNGSSLSHFRAKKLICFVLGFCSKDIFEILNCAWAI